MNRHERANENTPIASHLMLRLTDTEKQDIIRFLEAGKPLPEKYRFLLFDDKREVELVWNGKTNEVCNVVLPFQTIEHVDEPRSEDATARAARTAEGKEHQQLLFSVDDRGRQLKGWTPTAHQGQAHLGRQQANPLQPQERPAARGDRGSGWPQADRHRPPAADSLARSIHSTNRFKLGPTQFKWAA